MDIFILAISCLISGWIGFIIGAYLTYNSMNAIIRRKVARILKNQKHK